jgi:hypothetical protein
MEWALLGLSIVFLFISWVIVQGTRAQLAYRRAIAAGDLDVLRQVVQEALEQWRTMKRPRDVPPPVWRGIQGMELVSLDTDHIRVRLLAEGEFQMIDGEWREVRNPLEQGMSLTAKALEMLLYDIPNVRLPWAQVDIYTPYRDQTGRPQLRCILSTAAHREAARRVDWDTWTPKQIVDYFGGRYRLGPEGEPLAVEPLMAVGGR